MTITIKKKEFKSLYVTACNGWKEKLGKLFSEDLFSDEITFEYSFVIEMQQACDEKQLKIFNKIFSSFLPKEVEIGGLLDVYRILGIKDESYLPYKCPKTKEEKSLNAQARLFKITEAYNQGVKLDFKNNNQNKYYNYKYWSCGSWVVGVFVCVLFALALPAGLYFAERKNAEKAYKLFSSIYEEYWMQ